MRTPSIRFSPISPLVALASLVAAVIPAPSQAADLNWQIRSLYRYQVEIVFYSTTRNWQWPGQGQVWVLNDDNFKSFSLNCQYGEKICYGAWVRGDTSRYWGVGYNNRQSCNNCCYVCGYGATQAITLR
jgi:hypothetical protein